MVHEHIRDGKDEEFESKNAGKSLNEISPDNLPPCSRDPGVFSSIGFKIIHHDPLNWRNLPSVPEDIPPYSFCTSPYRRMFKENGKGWENNPQKQLHNLKEFWDKIEPGKSLVFFYVNHGNPLKEEKSDRILVGIGRISKLGKQLYFGKKEGYEDDYPLWSRCVTINFPGEGIRLPYQEYLNGGHDPSNIICVIPTSARPYFSYVAEHVPDDIAVGILERVIQSVNTIIEENKVHEPYGKTWEFRLKWLNKVLSEVWKNRGRFPGIGSVLEYLGFENGVTYHRSVLSPKEANGESIFDFIFSILECKRKPPKERQEDFKKACDKWRELPEKRRKLLKLLTHFELSTEQVERICNPTKREEAFIKVSEDRIIENPYIISELDDGDKNSPPVDFETIDRGMLPSEEIARVKSSLKTINKDDKRRVRALLVEILKGASKEGDTFLSIDEAIKRVRKRLPQNRSCEPDKGIILYNRKFYEERLAFLPDENPQVIALKSLRRQEEEIRKRLNRMVKKEYQKRPDNNFWKQLMEEELKDIRISDKEIEEKAREEKLKALHNIFRFRFSVLTGRAGTGKTTVLKVLLRGIKKEEGNRPILLLAPTGKARVRLQEITGQEAQTIHQFLMKLGWIKEETFSLKEEGEKQGASTIIIDEASMIPTDLLATLFRAIDFNDVKRLILVGDPNQLPPIGPGRPFVDIIKWLESSEDKEKHIARLTQRVRHEDKESQALKLADAFLGDKISPADDEILSKVARREVSGDLEAHFWNDEKELYDVLDKCLKENLNLFQDERPDYKGFNKSIENPDNWQILSPTRMQVFGTTEINRIIQKEYKGGFIEKAKKEKMPGPFGEQQMVWLDKVIQIVNSRREGWKDGNRVDGYVANGEVGKIDRTNKKYIDVKFSTQPDLSYRYYSSEVDENLELAYAITVHKSQGSDFDIVFFVLPQKAGTMSRELIYTALTRFRKKVILLIEKDIAPLITFRKPQYSEILRRNTSLFELVGRPEEIRLLHPEHLIHITKKGELVRSKSEVIIANILSDLGISYEYEKPLYSKEGRKDFRLPDFTIKYEGEVFYWEHLGMLEDPEYKNDWERKREWYEKNGYIDRLIVSKDKPDGGIDSREIVKLAKEKILGIKS